MRRFRIPPTLLLWALFAAPTTALAADPPETTLPPTRTVIEDHPHLAHMYAERSAARWRFTMGLSTIPITGIVFAFGATEITEDPRVDNVCFIAGLTGLLVSTTTTVMNLGAMATWNRRTARMERHLGLAVVPGKTSSVALSGRF